MFYKFPPLQVLPGDHTFLTSRTEIFAKLKIETNAGKRTVHLTEHTLIFVISGTKLLHFPEKTVEIAPGNIILLKKGVYVMAEYFEGLSFEALMLFLPLKLLRSFVSSMPHKKQTGNNELPFTVFANNNLIAGFRDQLRQYFNNSIVNADELLSHKQKEILLLLTASGYKQQLLDFLIAAISTQPFDLEHTVKNHLLQPLTLAELANLCNHSLASFKRHFHKQFQCPPRQWINRQRLAQAQLLLQNTQKSIGEIAVECGFESPSYFTRLYKKQFGYVPGAIRAKSAII